MVTPRPEDPAAYRVGSRKLLRSPTLPVLLGAPLRWWWAGFHPAGDTVLGWGRRPIAEKLAAFAGRRERRFVRAEDGFLRSFGTGDQYPALSVVLDDVGIYYDSSRPSALENQLNSGADVLAGLADDVARARGLLLEHGLSKYNHAPDYTGRPAPGRKAVLVVDQTAGDLSVTLGGAGAATFGEMLAAARAEHPGAVVYVKTHPEVSAGRKGGYLTQVQDDENTVVLREAINPLSLIRHMDHVYVVSSTMGFEALLAGKPVTCFGLPWYAGWGVTDDRQRCARRTRRRTLDELFAAAYFHYTRYLDPVRWQRGTIFDVIDFLALQREKARHLRTPAGPRRMICVGFERWRVYNLKPLLSLYDSAVQFAPDVPAARALEPRQGDALIFWGATAPAGLQELARGSWAHALRMEDGFVRSVGLGSDLIRPLSLVLDEGGIYFDPRQPSDLEELLQTGEFGARELARARGVREYIVAHGITKYNLEPREAARWPSGGRPVVLVPGQVEDDASIRLGCTDVRTNLELLRVARQARPDAFLVYKPHPDVLSRNRGGRLAMARGLADHVETRLSVVSCIEACDEVHTMTSLSGFDALLRGKRVVTYGQPFYAGWGLTQDQARDGVALARRRRRLTLDELVAGALLRYPFYWDWELRGYTSCEAVLHRIVRQRGALEAGKGLERLRVGYLRRQARKFGVVLRAMAAGAA